MVSKIERGLPQPEAEEVESCCYLLGKLKDLATQQAQGAAALPPESLLHAFSLAHALVDRVEQLLTQALAPPEPEPPPEPPPEPEPVEATAQGGGNQQ